MAKKPTRKGLPKKKKETNGPSIFDFLNDITLHKKNILCEENVHAYNPFMIIRFLATRQECLEYCDFLSKHLSHLDKYEFHTTAIYLCPLESRFSLVGKKLKYTPRMDEIQDDLQWIQQKFMVSKETSYQYYLLLEPTERKEFIRDIKRLYGVI